jgi:malate dehydrogenase (oxaloacetate-decarboxylating)(NADP+)
LGDIGPEASNQWKERDCCLKFLLILMCLISKLEKDIEEFIQTVKNISPTFGGINLEDIKAPESFEIEDVWLKS